MDNTAEIKELMILAKMNMIEMLESYVDFVEFSMNRFYDDITYYTFAKHTKEQWSKILNQLKEEVKGESDE